MHSDANKCIHLLPMTAHGGQEPNTTWHMRHSTRGLDDGARFGILIYLCTRMYVCMSGLHLVKLALYLLLSVSVPLRFLFILNMSLALCKKSRIQIYIFLSYEEGEHVREFRILITRSCEMKMNKSAHMHVCQYIWSSNEY